MYIRDYILLQKGDQGGEEAKARLAFRAGMILYGYCCGIFGRDSYGEKEIISVGNNYITVKEDGAVGTHDVYSWIDLLDSSNDALEELERE